jgi:hypothetical protein
MNWQLLHVKEWEYHFYLQSFTLRTVFIEEITFINEGIPVSLFSISKKTVIAQEQGF